MENKTVEKFKHQTAENLAYRAYELNQGGKQFLPKTRMYLQKEYQEKLQKEQLVIKLEGQIDQLQRRLSVITVQNEHLTEEIRTLTKKVNEKDVENESIRNKYYDLLHDHDLLKLEMRAESSYLIQNQHLKHDNSKLVEMLKGTKEFSSWAERADDAVGSLRFLKNLETHQLLSQKGYMHYCACNPKAIIQNEKWVPQSAYKTALRLMEKNNWNMNEKLLDELLYVISKFYSERQINLVNHVKKMNTKEVEKLKRQINYQDNIVDKKEMARLKKTMDRLARENVQMTFKQRQPLEEEKILKTAARATNSMNKMQRKIELAKEMGKEERKQDLRKGFSQTLHI